MAALEREAVGAKNVEGQLTLESMPSLFAESLISWIRLLFLTDSKLYCSRMLPISKLMIELTRQLLSSG